MINFLENKYLNLVIRVIIGFLFIFAGIGKVVDPALFSKEIINYSIMPLWAVNVFALVLPWVEVVSGMLLISGVRIKANAMITGLLMLVFIVAVFSAMVRGLNINCGCFSNKIVLVGWTKIIENLLSFLGCLYLFLYPVKNFSVENLN